VECGVCLDMGKNPTIFYVLANIRNTLAIATDHVPSIFNLKFPEQNNSNPLISK